jgi:hypothetical protein
MMHANSHRVHRCAYEADNAGVSVNPVVLQRCSARAINYVRLKCEMPLLSTEVVDCTDDPVAGSTGTGAVAVSVAGGGTIGAAGSAAGIAAEIDSVTVAGTSTAGAAGAASGINADSTAGVGDGADDVSGAAVAAVLAAACPCFINTTTTFSHSRTPLRYRRESRKFFLPTSRA